MDAATTPERDDLPLRERKKLRTREALHDAARTLALADGAFTVEDACRAAGVSPRTFFNYYPSKTAAALGLPDLRVTEEQRERFLAADGGPIVPDLCRVVAEAIDATGAGQPDKAAMHELLARRPELRQEVYHWMSDARRGFMELAEARATPARARAAVALVFAALGHSIEHVEQHGTLESRLIGTVAEMVAAATDSRTDSLLTVG